MSEDLVISATGLTKRFGDVLAVDRLDLRVRHGEVYAFLGRNGAGKTTTIRMLLGLIRPTEGQAWILGQPVTGANRRWLARVGFLVESATAYPNLTVRENLDLQRRLLRAPRDSVGEVIERLGLGAYADRRAGRLSLGNKQRLALARALVHEPELLILDEPANALDPAGIVEIRALLRQLVDDQGVTVLLSSHNLAEVAHVADRLGVVHAGRMVEEADRATFAERARVYVGEAFTPEEREQALLAADLERYFLARTRGGPP